MIANWFKYRVYFDGGFTRLTTVWLAVSIHLVQGSLLILDDSAAQITSVFHIVEWLGVSPAQLGIIYIAIAVMPILGWIFWPRGSIQRLLLITPQQGFLMAAALGAVLAIWESAFADGVVRNRSFIAADQWAIIATAIFHSVAMMQGTVARLRGR